MMRVPALGQLGQKEGQLQAREQHVKAESVLSVTHLLTSSRTYKPPQLHHNLFFHTTLQHRADFYPVVARHPAFPSCLPFPSPQARASIRHRRAFACSSTSTSTRLHSPTIQHILLGPRATTSPHSPLYTSSRHSITLPSHRHHGSHRPRRSKDLQEVCRALLNVCSYD